MQSMMDALEPRSSGYCPRSGQTDSIAAERWGGTAVPEVVACILTLENVPWARPA